MLDFYTMQSARVYNEPFVRYLVLSNPSIVEPSSSSSQLWP